MTGGTRATSDLEGLRLLPAERSRVGTLRTSALVVALSLLVPGFAHACDVEAADRQLKLAEADIAGGNPERGAAAASSALKLDPACTEALFVRGLALHRSGRESEASALLLTYRDLRGTLALDPRFELTFGLVEAAMQPFDAARGLRLADMALTQLDLDVAADQLAAVEAAEPRGEVHARMLGLQAQLLWGRGDRDAAERTWRRLFADHPGAAVDSELPPEQIAAMARAQEAVSAGTTTRTALRADPTAPWVVLGSTGAGLAVAGVVVAGVEHSRGAGLLDSMTGTGGYIDNVDAYDGARRGEQFGVVLSGVGTAALVGGVVAALVQRAESKRLQNRQEARR